MFVTYLSLGFLQEHEELKRRTYGRSYKTFLADLKVTHLYFVADGRGRHKKGFVSCNAAKSVCNKKNVCFAEL